MKVEIFINTTVRDLDPIFHVAIRPSGGSAGWEVPFRKFFGSEGYVEASSLLEFEPDETYGVRCELMAEGKVYILDYELSDAGIRAFGWDPKRSRPLAN